jgi:hypothetical protein
VTIPLPPPSWPITEPKKGIITVPWYNHFKSQAAGTANTPWIDARDFGVTGDGGNQTEGMQAVWDHAVSITGIFGGAHIILPAGDILIDPDQIVLDGSDGGGRRCISVSGMGKNATNIVVSGDGSVGIAVTGTAHNKLCDFGMQVTEEVETLALLKLDDTFGAFVEGVKLQDGFIDLDLVDNVLITVRDCYLTTGGYFSEATSKTGSRCLRTSDLGPATFINNSFEGSTKTEYSFEVIKADILRICHNHFHDSDKADLRLISNSAIQQVIIANNTFDNDTAVTEAIMSLDEGTNANFRNIVITGNYIRSNSASIPAILYNGSNITDVIETANVFTATVDRTVTSVAAEGLAYDAAGTWTPTLGTTGTQFDSVTYDATTGGRYVRRGNLVHIQGLVVTDAVTVGSGTGTVVIGGLPFTAVANTGATLDGNSAISVSAVSGWAGEEPIAAIAVANSTSIALYYRTAVDGNETLTAIADVGTGANANVIAFAGTYIAS